MNAKLSVDPKKLKDALKKIKLSDRRFSVGEAAFSFNDGWLELQAQGVSVQITASGTWPGRVRVSLYNLRPMLSHPPKENPLLIRFQDDLLFFGSYSVSAQWEDISPQPELIPMGLSWVELLKLRFEYPEAALISSGMAPKIAMAEKKFEIRISKAAALLVETGVKEQDLMELVVGKLGESKKR
ncbi:MAG: hypothetical protein V1794_07715 [Candidatus Glassbacteria bacterium]